MKLKSKGSLRDSEDEPARAKEDQSKPEHRPPPPKPSETKPSEEAGSSTVVGDDASTVNRVDPPASSSSLGASQNDPKAVGGNESQLDSSMEEGEDCVEVEGGEDTEPEVGGGQAEEVRRASHADESEPEEEEETEKITSRGPDNKESDDDQGKKI